MTVPVAEEGCVPVSVLPLPPGEEVDCLLPPEPECPLKTLAEVAEGGLGGEHCLCLRVETVETHITFQTHLVAENRVRCVLRDIMSDLKCFCWFFGDYSDKLVSHGMRTGDMVIMVRPRVVKTKLKYRQVLPEDMSGWTIHCLMRDRRPVTLVKVEQERSKEAACGRDPCDTAIDALIEAIENDTDSEFRSQARPSDARADSQPQAGPGPVTSTQEDMAEEGVVPMPPPASNLSPIKTQVQASLAPRPASPRSQARPQYTLLAQCRTHKQRYNVMAVLTEIIETPRRRKSKIVAKVMITDESLEVAGDLREHFKFDILTDSMDQMPDLEVGSVLRIHHMVVEVFNERADGRVFSGACVTSVSGGPDTGIVPECPGARTGGKEVTWGQEDDLRVEQLRSMWTGETSEPRQLEEITGECLSRVTGRVMGVYTCPGQVVIRLEDGTVSSLMSVEYRGPDTETMEQAGDNKQWVDVWCDNAETVDKVRSLALETGDLVTLDRLRCAVLADSLVDQGTVFRLVMERRGKIHRLEPDSAEAEEMRRRLGPRPGEPDSEASGSFVDRMLAAVNKNNETFQPPQSESLAASQTTLGGEQTRAGESVVDQKISSNPNNSDDTKSAKSNPEERVSIKRPRSVTPPPSLKSIRTSMVRTPSPTLKRKKPRLSAQSSDITEVSINLPFRVTKKSQKTKVEDDGLSLTSKSTFRSRSESPTTSTPLKFSLRSRSQTPPALRNPLKRRKESRNKGEEESACSLSSLASSPSPPSLPCAQPRVSLLTPADGHPSPRDSPQLSSLPSSQMSEFLSDASPLRTRPSPESPPSRQASLSLYGSCGGSPRQDATECTLLQDSEEIEVSQGDDKDKGLENRDDKKEEKKDEEIGMDIGDKDNRPDDSGVSQYSLNSESDFELSQCSSSMFSPPGNSTLSRITPPRAGEPPGDQSKDKVFEERSQHLLDSLERMSQALVTEEITDDENENKSSSDKTEEGSDLSALKDRDNQVKESEGQKRKNMTIAEYRTHLVARCLDTGRDWRRVTCDNVSRAAPGTYRILGIVRSVNNKEYTMMGYCRQCGKLDRVENFENRDQQLFCCDKEEPVSLRIHIVMVITDHTDVTGVTVVVSGAQAETFLDLEAGSWSLEAGLPRASLAKLEEVEGGIVELGVEVLAESRVLLVLNTVVTC